MTTAHDSTAHLPEAAQGCVLAIGNFDGFHLGHRALVARARAVADELRAPFGVLTFEPHPRQFFQSSGAPFRLTLPPMKRRLVAAQGVDRIFSLTFDKVLSALAAEEFIDRILVHDLRARHVVVGRDFRFGRGRGGSAETLAACGKFGLTVAEPVLSPEGEVYASTAIRDYLRKGDFATAEKFLGWPWQIEAPVVPGDQRGRALGYPTANQNVPEYVRPPYGIFAVRVQVEGETVWRDGVANFGIRPMFKIEQPIFETFIFDFSRDIYGYNLRVCPVRHLRPEAAFESVEALVLQMKEDCIAARAVLESIPAPR